MVDVPHIYTRIYLKFISHCYWLRLSITLKSHSHLFSNNCFFPSYKPRLSQSQHKVSKTFFVCWFFYFIFYVIFIIMLFHLSKNNNAFFKCKTLCTKLVYEQKKNTRLNKKKGFIGVWQINAKWANINQTQNCWRSRRKEN